jgi:hypothetical protein
MQFIGQRITMNAPGVSFTSLGNAWQEYSKLKARPHELTNDDIRIMVNEYIEDRKMEQFIANSRGDDHERRGDNERRAVQRILRSSEKSHDEETEAVILLGN